MSRLPLDVIDILSEEDARKVVAPHFETFRGCIEDGIRAVEEMEASRSDFFHVYPAGARATIVFWQIVNRAESRFYDIQDVSVSHNRGFLTILIAESLEIRFKKLNRMNLSSNYPTKYQKRYRFQLRLKDMEEPTRATAGYKLDADGKIKDILMVCERGREVEWSIPIPVASGKVVTHPKTKTPASDTPKVRPKKVQ